MFSYRLRAAAVAVAVALCGVQAAAQTAPTAAAPQDVQRRFAKIDTVLTFSGFFNIGQGAVRIVALLSPTCPRCVERFQELKRIMDAVPTRRLRTEVVFMPIEEGDTEAAAQKLATGMADRRVSYFWDEKMCVRDAFQPVLGSDPNQHHVCLLFDTDAVLRDKPDAPVWLMQITGSADDDAASGRELEARVRALLERFEDRQRANPEGNPGE